MAFTKFRVKRDKSRQASPDADDAAELSPEDVIGPSPDPDTNLLLADLALRGGTTLVRQGIERGLLGRKYGAGKAAKILKQRPLGESLLHSTLVRLATRSVPGAIVVGGGLLAKTLSDRRRLRKARQQTPAPPPVVEEDGEES